ncbi:MAG: hypothetical protein NWE89_09560 [Candidatus Bathyarchaeota archaeon]|nr:hypothetical protein [Candidatus Bathyarchaeota archaeon]
MRQCSVFHDGQEILVGEKLLMPERFCDVAWRNFYNNIRTIERN